MEKRNIQIDIDTARKWYLSRDSFKQELALQAFTEEELKKPELPTCIKEFNILEILKKIPNLEDMVFYSPLYGDVKVDLKLSYNFIDPDYIVIISPSRSIFNVHLNECGIFYEGGECMLYPSRHNRDWSTFKIPRKDLPKGTRVLVSEYGNFNEEGWTLRTYAGLGQCFYPCKTDTVSWNYIIPVDKFNFKYCTFKDEDNYGTTRKS